jgi:hypothetical protein
MSDDAKTPVPNPLADPPEDLPYRIELWAPGSSANIDRVLARALNIELAQAIFRAAQVEYPERRVTLRKGDRVVADTTNVE